MYDQITLDGPAASGKSSIAKKLAEQLNAFHVNSGEMYRFITYLVLGLKANVEYGQHHIVNLVRHLSIDYKREGNVLLGALNGVPYNPDVLRRPDVTALVAKVAVIPEVREEVIRIQRSAAQYGLLIMEGRDIGTVVFPEAQYKFYITASPEVRARRRFAQKGETPEDAELEDVIEEIMQRDHLDMTRVVSPLIPAKDAIIINTDDLTIDEAVNLMVKHIKRQPTADVVFGTAWGDEGKGKIVQHLIQKNKYDVCARFNGGPNAGHTIYHEGEKIVTHGIPTGVVYGCEGLIGPGCVVDLIKLENELKYLEEKFLGIRDRVKIAYNAHVIDEEAIEEDKKSDQVGTTLSGIGPTYSRKALRTGKRICDFVKDKKVLGCEVVDSSNYLKRRTILFEGAQGFLLDPDWGTYPYVTSSSCLVSQVLTTGIPFSSLRNVWGVAKMYDTYVGSMKMMPENDQELRDIQTLGNEFGATTGRPRQCNWMNLDNLLKAIWVNGIDTLVVNKCDIVTTIGLFKLYHNGDLVEFDSIGEMKQYITRFIIGQGVCKTIYWSESPDHL